MPEKWFKTDEERFEVIDKAISGVTKDVGKFPCRLDEMTEREGRIAEMCCQLMGTMQFIQRVLQERGDG